MKITNLTLSIVLILALGLLAGCDLLPPEAGSPAPDSVPGPSPTPEVLPTTLPEDPATTTPEVLVVVIPADTPAPGGPQINPTQPPIPTATATINPSASMLLQLVNPGPMSKVVSPIRVSFVIHPQYTGSTRIELISESGRELFRKVYNVSSPEGGYIRLVEEVPFEIPGAAELARLQVSTVDRFGRLQAFNSVRLLLLKVGENQFTQPYEALERLSLRGLRPDTEVVGGEIKLEGRFLPLTNSPLIFEIIDERGVVIGSRIVLVDTPNGSYQDILTSLPYTVSSQTRVRLTARQADDRIAGLAYLYSVELILWP